MVSRWIQGGDQERNASIRNSRVLPITRLVSALLVPFLITAGVILYIWPDRTEELFAWPIQPRMTALLMGAGYLSGAYFFLRAAFDANWQSIRLGFLPITAFAWLAAIATLLHWGRFNHDHPSFYVWVALYAITPLLVPALWWVNRSRFLPVAEGNSPLIPRGVAGGLAAASGLFLIFGAILFLMPGLLAGLWPWPLTPLTSRILGSWFVLPGLIDLSIAITRRWDATHLILETQLVGLFFLLLGIFRAWNTLQQNPPLAWVFAVGIGLLFAGLLGLYLQTNKKAANPA